MRLSTDSSDPGYHPACTGVRVFFCGSEVTGVFTADEEQRLIVQADLDSAGRIQLAPCQTKVKKVTRYGDVRIEIPEGHALRRLFARGHEEKVNAR